MACSGQSLKTVCNLSRLVAIGFTGSKNTVLGSYCEWQEKRLKVFGSRGEGVRGAGERG